MTKTTTRGKLRTAAEQATNSEQIGREVNLESWLDHPKKGLRISIIVKQKVKLGIVIVLKH